MTFKNWFNFICHLKWLVVFCTVLFYSKLYCSRNVIIDKNVFIWNPSYIFLFFVCILGGVYAVCKYNCTFGRRHELQGSSPVRVYQTWTGRLLGKTEAYGKRGPTGTVSFNVLLKLWKENQIRKSRCSGVVRINKIKIIGKF